MPRKKPPELTFQQHIADFLVRVYGYAVLDQSGITDTEHFIAEDHLWAFLNATQAEQLKKLQHDYGTDARDEVFRALRTELDRTPLWMLLRHGLQVRGLEFRLFYPAPRSASSAAVTKHAENRITFRPHFYFGVVGSGHNHEIDFVFFLNGLPIVALELKHEKNQNIHDAVAQYARRDHAVGIFQHPFLYIAADTSDVMAATDPRRVENFRWHNTGLTNAPLTASEYRSSFSTASCWPKASCWRCCRSSCCVCPSARRMATSPNGPPSPSRRATTRAAWCVRWPTMPWRTSPPVATSAANT